MNQRAWEFLYDDAFWQKRHFIFFGYACQTDSFEVQLNLEAQEYVWIALEGAQTLPMNAFTRRALREYVDQVVNDQQRAAEGNSMCLDRCQTGEIRKATL